jgi:hypothetical protein
MHRFVMAAVFTGGLALILMIAVPNLLTAHHRSLQKRSMADMRTISTAWEARATDTNSYSIEAAPTCKIAATAESFGKLCEVSGEQLARALEPTYIKHLPRTDAWGAPFDFRLGGYNAKGQAQTYAIRSHGSDQRADAESYASGTIERFEQDLVYSNGSFLRFPEGI